MFYSFDIFDTIVTRTTITPRGIFSLMQFSLEHHHSNIRIPRNIVVRFCELRISSEIEARARYCTDSIQEISLQQIYFVMGKKAGLTDKQIEHMKALEIQTEKENIVGIEENIKKIIGLVEHNERVALISDMYLSESVVREILIGISSIFKNVPVYVSCDFGKSKKSGELFQKVKDIECINYSEWRHMGDNNISDIAVPEQLGIGAIYYSQSLPNDYEKNMIADREADTALQLLLGTARNARVRYDLQNESELGCSIAGPILVPYVQWILVRCCELGVKRLYFIARDGYVLKKIADLIIKRRGYSISTEYIYGSRRAMRIMPTEFDRDCLPRFISSIIDLMCCNVREIAHNISVPIDELIGYLPTAYTDLNRSLTRVDIFIIREILCHNEIFLQQYFDNTCAKQGRVISYLQQTIDVSDRNFAFVDLQGTGMTMCCLSKLISTFSPHPLRGFFYTIAGQYQKVKSVNSDTCIFESFLPESCMEKQVNIVEALCRAPHGQTIDYQDNGGTMEPILEVQGTEPLIEHHFPEYLSGIMQFTETCSNIANDFDTLLSDYTKSIISLRYVKDTPNQFVMDFIGDMPFEGTGVSTDVTKYAPILSKKEIYNIYFLGKRRTDRRYYSGNDFEYSLLRCSVSDKKLIEQFQSICTPDVRAWLAADTSDFVKKHDCDREAALIWLSSIGVRENADIVLYGAGAWGRELAAFINATKCCNVVLWADRNFAELRKCGYNVEEPDKLRNISYDKVLVTVLNKALTASIKQDILKLSVPEDKIAFLCAN